MIEIRKLNFGYIKQPICLKDIDFSLQEGKKVMLLGGEGAGKTTLLRLIAGLEEQFFGTITIDGKNIAEFKNAPRPISYLPTQPVLINKTIGANLDYLFKTQNMTSLKESEIEEIFKLFNFNFSLKTKVKKLSSADKKVLSIIRSYIKNPSIVLIDDLTENESEENIIKIKNAISLLINEKSDIKIVICAAKNQNLLFDFESIFYLSYGNLYKFKSIEELKFIDLFANNYLNYPSFDFVLKKSEEYQLFEFTKQKVKKKEVINLTAMHKLSKTINDCLEKQLHFENEEQMFVTLVAPDCESVETTTLNRNLENHTYALFNKTIGDKLI